jgi:hypothetical protein
MNRSFKGKGVPLRYCQIIAGGNPIEIGIGIAIEKNYYTGMLNPEPDSDPAKTFERHR